VAVRTRGRVFPRGKQRLTSWFGPADQGFITVASGAKVLVANLPFEESLTLVRTRGVVAIKVQSYTADVSPVGAIGMGIVSQEAFAAGVASVPDPISNPDWGGWFVWRTFAMHFENISQVGVLLGSWSFEVDSKAMRKISPNEVLVIVAASQSGAFSIYDGTRHLVKLS